MDARALFLQRLIINAFKKTGVPLKRTRAGQTITILDPKKPSVLVDVLVSDIATYLSDHGAGS